MDRVTAYRLINADDVDVESDTYKEALQYLNEHGYATALKKFLNKIKLNHKY